MPRAGEPRPATRRFSLSSAPTIVVQDAFTTRRRRRQQQQLDRSVRARRQLRLQRRHEAPDARRRAARRLPSTRTSTSATRPARGPTGPSRISCAGRPQQFSQRLGTVDTSFTPVPGGLLLVRRVPRAPRCHARRRRAQRAAVAHRRQAEPDAAPRLHVGAVRQPALGDSRRLRPLLRLVRLEPLRPDAARGRHRRSATSASPASRTTAIAPSVERVRPAGGGRLATPSGRIQASPDLQMPRVHQASISYDRQLTPNITLQTSYQMLRGQNQMRSRNINAPVDGVRPNPAFGDITQFESTGRSQSDRLTVGTRVPPAVARRSSRRCSTSTTRSARRRTHADGATSLPSDSLNPDVDWGPSRQDIRHRVQLQAQMPLLLRRPRQRQPERRARACRTT